MKKNIWSIGAAGVLSTAICISGPGGLTALGGDYNGRSGEGYRCEAASRDPDPVSAGNLGSMRAIGQNNAIDTGLLDYVNLFSYKTAAQVLLDNEAGTRSNINYSPVALYCALAMASQGAGGNTRNQLITVLEASQLEPGKLADGCGRMYRQMYRENECGRLKLINTMWLREGNPIGDDFRRIAEGQYYVSAFRVDFANGAVPGIMRQWIGDQTGQTVTSEVAVAPGDTMRLLNSAYFYNQWTYAFDEVPGSTGIFHGPGGQEIQCQYMTDQSNSSYYKGQGFVRAARSMQNNAMMIFVLPDEGVPIQDLLASEEQMKEMFGHAAESYGCVSWKVPKFDTAASLDLAPMLQRLGVTDAFQPQTADFTGISGEGFSLGGVVQETRFNIDTKGVGIPGYTGHLMEDTFSTGEPQLDFHLDRPFLYSVTVAPGVPLYIGVCNNPAAF